jgi:hypothetical protein
VAERIQLTYDDSRRADERTRTADLLITSELLYLLSYVGLLRLVSISQGVRGVILLLVRPDLYRALELAATPLDDVVR